VKTNIEHTHIVDFFEKIDFAFGKDIKPRKIIISENDELTEKLKNKVFVYDNPDEQTHTSFYVITTELSDKELFEIRRYIWNEDRYNLYFLFINIKNTLTSTLCYAKSNPRKEKEIIASFKGNEEDNEELEKIKKWNFDSGKFWLNYADFLGKIEEKRARIDKKLIEQLKSLRTELKECLKSQEGNTDEIVQSLIDRTLFIKFLEDKHIINSFFYKHYFPNDFLKNARFKYRDLLENYDANAVNKLFTEINGLFSNVLFREPEIEIHHLTKEVLKAIYNAVRQYNWQSGQLSLFDFRFDVVPVEFISHIYEVFLEGKQLNEGIYYTPPNLAHLIIDDTIKGLGTVLDPSCGSGMFLVLAFRKLLEYQPVSPDADVVEKISHKNELLKDYIFGIEKENTAWRLCLFSLYLEILKDIPPEEIKQFIEQKIKNNSLQPIFPYDFSDNIIEGNSLEIEADKKPHNNRFFDYMVGNPPFLQIKQDSDEIHFINKYQITIDDTEIKVKNIIGDHQISQAFMLKIKDWSNTKTRFGFVQNSSNFYNEQSVSFREFFFKHYNIETFYELSRVKEMLFSEPVVVTIFSNQINQDNYVHYYPVDMEIFSKIFDLLIIQEDKKINITQSDILNGNLILRDYLIGNEYDLALLNSLTNNSKLETFILPKDKISYGSFRGLERAEAYKVAKQFNIPKTEYQKISKEEKSDLQNRFAAERYLSKKQTDYYDIPYIHEAANVSAFSVMKFDGFINKNDINKTNFRGPKSFELFKGDKILFNRFGDKLEAAYVPIDCFFSAYLYIIKLKHKNKYNLFTAILNSDLVDYYLTQKYRKRVYGNFTNLDLKAVKNIPVPKYLDEDLVEKISVISQQLTEGKLQYEGVIKEKLNHLIYRLYGLNILEIDRIKHFFIEKRKVNHQDLEEYRAALYETIEFFIKNEITIESSLGTNLPFGLVVTAIYFNQTENTQPTSKKTLQYFINEMLKNTDEKFLAMREMMFCKDCIYIVKNDNFHSWSTTKAFEDGQRILKTLRK